MEKEKWIVMQTNLGMGHYGELIITTQERVDNNLPMIAKDVVDEEHACRICQCVNAYKALLDACKRDAELADAAILSTPSGEYRNKLTEINILRMQAIAEVKKGEQNGKIY